MVQKAYMMAQSDLAKQAAEQNQMAPNPLPTSASLPVDPQVTLASASQIQSVSVAMPSIETMDVLGKSKSNPVIAMYAAGLR